MKILFLFLIFHFSLTTAFACSCINMNDTEKVKALENASAVFQGEVIFVGEDTIHFMKDEKDKYYETTEGEKIVDRGSKDFVFRIEKYWKGVESAEITVQTRLDSCRWVFEKGEKAIIVAAKNRYEESGKPHLIDQCGLYLAKPELIKKVFGEGETFAEKQQSQNISANLLSIIWQKITSFFS